MNNSRQSRIMLGYNSLLVADGMLWQNGLSLPSFEDFNHLIEAVVLYDKIVAVGDFTLQDGPLIDAIRSEGMLEVVGVDSLTEMLTPQVIDNYYSGITHAFGSDAADDQDSSPIAVLNHRLNPNYFDQFSYNNMATEVARMGVSAAGGQETFQKWLHDHLYLTRHRGGHYSYVARSLLYSAAANGAGMDYSPDFLRLPIVKMTFALRNRSIPRVFCDRLNSKLEHEIADFVILGMPITVFIPPITARLLDRSEGDNSLIPELLSMRQEFADVRCTYNLLGAVMANDDATLSEKLRQKRELVDKLSAMINGAEIADSMSLKLLWDKLVGGEAGSDGVDVNISIAATLSKSLEVYLERRLKGKVKALFDLWADTMKIKNYGTLLERSFRSRIDSREIDFCASYAKGVSRLSSVAQNRAI